MLSRPLFFKPIIMLTSYQAMKESFIACLDETENKCSKMCFNHYDSHERNFSISYHPAIEEKKFKIVNTKKRVLEELDRIERVGRSVEDKASMLVDYGKRLADEIVRSLFLEIFIGKIKKRWLPRIAEPGQEYQEYKGQVSTIIDSI